MRGKVEPGALCMVIGGDSAGQTVRVVRSADTLEQAALAGEIGPQYWCVARTDSSTMKVWAGMNGDIPVLVRQAFVKEPWLLPIDPDADIKSQRAADTARPSS